MTDQAAKALLASIVPDATTVSPAWAVKGLHGAGYRTFFLANGALLAYRDGRVYSHRQRHGQYSAEMVMWTMFKG